MATVVTVHSELPKVSDEIRDLTVGTKEPTHEAMDQLKPTHKNEKNDCLLTELYKESEPTQRGNHSYNNFYGNILPAIENEQNDDMNDVLNSSYSRKQPARNTTKDEKRKCDFFPLSDLLKGEWIIKEVENTTYIVFYVESEEEARTDTEETEDVAKNSPSFNEDAEESSEKEKSNTKAPLSADGLGAAGHKIITSDQFQASGDIDSGRAPHSLTRSIGLGIFRATSSVTSGILKGVNGLANSAYEGSGNGILGIARGLGAGMIDFGSHAVRGAFRGVSQVTNAVGEVLHGPAPHFSLDGVIILTNYRIIWISWNYSDKFEIPLGVLNSIENSVTAPHILQIEGKNLMRPTFSFPSEELCEEFTRSVLQTFTEKDKTFLSVNTTSTPISSSQSILDPSRDYDRLGLTRQDSGFKLFDNSSFQLFPTYPDQFIIPSGVNDDDVRDLAEYRSARRIPAVTWIHPISKATITRCSQPCTGLRGYVSEADKRIVASLQNNKLFHFVDARSSIAAAANQAQGKGTEDVRNYPLSELHYCDISNIHAVRNSYWYLSLLCQPGQMRKTEEWGIELEQTLWLKFLNSILKAALMCAKFLQEGESVMIHCSDGWDRTPQLTSIVQILLDPYYRTLLGFLTLIEKEWISFGHKFRSRFSHGTTPNSHEVEEQSPVFVQFLDCVYQIYRQSPWAFEFDDSLLLYLYEHVFSCLYENFLYDSIKERLDTKPKEAVTSIFSFIVSQKDKFINIKYDHEKSFTMGEKLFETNLVVDDLVLWGAHLMIANPICGKYE